MHPSPAFRREDHALIASLIDEIGFGMVFAATPDGPRVAHVPLLQTADGALHFHLARGNALTRHLDGATALAVINGPDAYVSPRWYGDDPDQVPTWNYVALEIEGRVRQVEEDALLAQLAALSAREEARLPAPAWTMAKANPAYVAKLLGAITGFELKVEALRPTFKLSQNKPAPQRASVIAGLKTCGAHAIAALMENLV
jgi:transcriptional regulator